MALPVNFDADSAARIYRAVREVERGNRDQKPLTFRTVADASRKVFRMATFTGNWNKNAAKVVTFLYVTNTPNTVIAYNLFSGITVSTAAIGPRNVGIAREGTAWHAIAAECE